MMTRARYLAQEGFGVDITVVTRMRSGCCVDPDESKGWIEGWMEKMGAVGKKRGMKSERRRE